MKNIILVAVYISLSFYAAAQPTINLGTTKKGPPEIPQINWNVLLGYPDIQPNEERLVYWVHGLTGDVGSFAKAADASENPEWNEGGFEARKLRSVQIGYNEEGSILSAANQVRQQINSAVTGTQGLSNIADPKYNFLIAHSQGGLVSNALLYRDFDPNNPTPESERYYGGLVTINSPLQGARIINNTPKLIEMSGEACDALTAGPRKEFTESSAFQIFDFFSKADLEANVIKAVDGVCGFIENSLVPAIFAGNLVPTTSNFYVGAEPIEWFNSRETPGIERIAFYGEEPEENLLMRTMEYFVTGPNSSEYGYWGANQDQGAVHEIFEKNKLEYEAKYWDFKLHQDYLANTWDCDDSAWIFFCFNYRTTVAKANAYKKGVDWFNTVSDVYRMNIGAIEYETITSGTCHCYVGPYPGGELWITYPGPCQEDPIWNCQYQFSEGYTFNIIEKPSDGVVLAESAVDMPFATAGPFLLDDSSHMQVRNNEALRDALTKLYDGEYRKFFRTLKKN